MRQEAGGGRLAAAGGCGGGVERRRRQGVRGVSEAGREKRSERGKGGVVGGGVSARR